MGEAKEIDVQERNAREAHQSDTGKQNSVILKFLHRAFVLCTSSCSNIPRRRFRL